MEKQFILAQKTLAVGEKCGLFQGLTIFVMSMISSSQKCIDNLLELLFKQ